MVRCEALLCWLAALSLGAFARLAPQARYANSSALLISSSSSEQSSAIVYTSFGGEPYPDSSSSSSLPLLSSVHSPSAVIETNTFTNPRPRQSNTLLVSSTPSSSPLVSSDDASNTTFSAYPTSFTISPTNQTVGRPRPNHTTITSTWEPSATKGSDDDTSTDDPNSPTSQTDCITLLLGYPETVYEILPNTTTITLPYGANATQTPEFTPIPYCCTTDCDLTSSTAALRKSGAPTSSSAVAIPFAGFAHQTTTVVITEKNPTTVYTSNHVPAFPGMTETKKASVQVTSDNAVPTFPAESPFSTTTSPKPTATAGAQVGSDQPGDGDSSSDSSSSGGAAAGGESSSGESSSGGTASEGSSSGGDGSSPGPPSGGSSSSGSSGGGSSGGSSSQQGEGSSGGSSSDDGSLGGSSSSDSGVSSNDDSSSGGSSSGDTPGAGSGGGSDTGGQGASSTISMIAGGVPIVLTPNTVVVDGQTVTLGPNITPTTVIANHQTFTVDASQVIAPGTVINIPTTQGGSNGASPTSTVIEGATVSLGGNVVYVGGTSYTFGPGAVQTTVVQNGQTISIGSAGVGFPTTTVMAVPVQTTAYLVLGGDVFYAVGSSVAIFGQETITYGSGIPQTSEIYNGETITIGPGGITQSATTLGGSSHPTGTQIGIAGGLGVTEIGSSIIVIQSTTFTIGPKAGSTTAVIMGNTISANPSAIEIGTITTLSYPLNPTTQAVTAGGITFTEIGTSLVVIGGTTFTIGSGAHTTTDVYNSQTISIGPGGVGLKTTTVVPPSATATVTKNGVEKVRPASMAMGVCICMGIGFGHLI